MFHVEHFARGGIPNALASLPPVGRYPICHAFDSPMPNVGISPIPKSDPDSAESARRRDYTTAYRKFSQKLSPAVRAKINGTASPDWPSTRTFALPVIADSPGYRSDDGDPVIETLNELAGLNGALPKIALWISDRLNGVDRPEGNDSSEVSVLGATAGLEQFRLAIARICEAKNPRLEALLVSLAIGMTLHGNANGYAIAAHFNLKPQTIHEMLGETCAVLGVSKPLSKANKSRYGKTQYSHNIRKAS